MLQFDGLELVEGEYILGVSKTFSVTCNVHIYFHIFILNIFFPIHILTHHNIP